MSGYILELSGSVTRKTVVYPNRYGLSITGDLYYGKGMDIKQKHPALIVGAPYGGVKEQGPCVYGNELAQKGFVVLTFDQSFMGDSSGFPRHVSSPDIFVENFSAAVDFLGLQPFVDREKIGAIGICGSGGFTTTSNLAMMNFPLLAYIDEISPRPILFVVGDRAHSKFFSENAYAAAKEPKELYTVADAEHIDLYDRRDRIPFDKLAEFFSGSLG